MTEIVLRAGTASDAAEIYRMLKALAVDIGQGEAFTAALEDVRRDAFGPARRYETLIADVDGRPSGLVAYFLTYSTYKGRPCLFVNDLYVAPEARGLRLGRRLMAWICGEARARGCCRVELHVLHNVPARAFYERIGMTDSGERPYVISGPALDDLADQSLERPDAT